MLTIALMLLQATAPSAEAEALGLRIAETGTLAQLAPMLARSDTEALVRDHPELDAADQAILRATAEATAAAAIARINVEMGHGYARTLDLATLRAVAAFNASPAAAAYRAAIVPVTAATMARIGELDFKKEALAAFCAKTGKACAAE